MKRLPSGGVGILRGCRYLPAASFLAIDGQEYANMRTVILIAAAALSLAACRNNDQADNTINVDENLSAENAVSNDVTAIDAVTGEDANMAADVNYINAGDLNAD